MANNPLLIRGRERSLIEQDKYPQIKEYGEYIAKNSQGKETLGLHYSQGGGISPGDFIGVVRIGKGENRAVLQVDSKFYNPEMDYIKMFVMCCEDSAIGGRVAGCFECWPEEEPIKLSKAKDFPLIIVTAYLRELNTLCVRHLRRNFTRQRENFTGKVKGKILIGENTRRNVIRGRIDRVYSEYQAISDDILENRLLRAALEKAARYVTQKYELTKKYKELYRWIHACRAHLQGVSVAHVSRRDFTAARKQGMFSFYRRPLNLAKAVLFHFGFNPHEDINEQEEAPSLVTPYAIDSARLFEYYAELHLRKKYPNRNIAPQKQVGGKISVRPDFYVPKSGGEPWIIDAKYKIISEKDGKFRYSEDDLYQIVAYSNHRDLVREMESEDTKINLSLVYPYITASENAEPVEVETITDFYSPITIYKIPCPVKTEDAESH